MGVSIIRRRQHQQEVDGLHPRHPCEDFLEVDALLLDENPGDELCLVLGNGAVLDLLDPFEPNWMTLERRINELPRPVVFDRLQLLDYGLPLVLITLGVNERGRLLCTHQ